MTIHIHDATYCPAIFYAAKSRKIAASVLSLVGGLIVLLTGVIGLIAGGPYWGGFGGWMGGMITGYHGLMGGVGRTGLNLVLYPYWY